MVTYPCMFAWQENNLSVAGNLHFFPLKRSYKVGNNSSLLNLRLYMSNLISVIFKWCIESWVLTMSKNYFKKLFWLIFFQLHCLHSFLTDRILKGRTELMNDLHTKKYNNTEHGVLCGMLFTISNILEKKMLANYSYIYCKKPV